VVLHLLGFQPPPIPKEARRRDHVIEPRHFLRDRVGRLERRGDGAPRDAVRRRWKILRERIAAMKAIWTQEEAEYHGKYVNFDKALVLPQARPEAVPAHPDGRRRASCRQRAADFERPLDAHRRRAYSEPVAESMADFRARAEKAGRDPGAVTVSIFGRGAG